MRVKFKQGMALAMSSVAALAIVQAAGAEAASSPEKIPAWVSAEIAEWKQLGLVKGDQLGKVNPGQPVTKAEFVAFVNRVFGYIDTGTQSFPDVPANAWYATDIAKAVAAGALVGGADGKMGPLETLTREKAAIILSRVFEVPAAPASGIAPFADDADISVWARDAVYALKNAGYAAGDATGAFQPQKALTRGEAVKMINNAMSKLINDSAAHADLNGANLVVNTAGGTLSNVHLTGNLYITPGVGEGDLTIKGSSVDGTIYVEGGGEHSITVEDTKAAHIVIRKPNGGVHVQLNGASDVGTVDFNNDGTLDNGSTNPVGHVNAGSGFSGTVGLSGPVTELNVLGGASVNIGAADIANLNVGTSGAGSRIQVSLSATISAFTANAATTVIGDGTIVNATINAGGVSLAKKPTGQLTVNADQASVGGETVTKTPEGAQETVPSGGGSTAPRVGYTYDQALAKLSDSGAEAQVKQYIRFLQDSTFKPSVANPATPMGTGTNSQTFVDYTFTVKPSVFASLPGVNTSVLTGNYLWLGTDSGVTRMDIDSGDSTSYTAANRKLNDNKVLLLIADGDAENPGVFAITATGVVHIQ